ncbi:hypothetical protein Cgig2_024845 [Carnegiea gigantea]|uniref:Protein PHYTOCHROME KINASE SUBSTRATE 1-like n=1 Tax=Carnegiea gigantea TaxID=171969 RepID=A0A9Q1KEE9_9CARY|nr:hypothetical protein Cgig2_024845 [Carnegiea gigantea]
MASIISSSSNTSLPPSWPSESDSTATLRDVSFSSYLNSSEEAYIRTLVQSSQSHRISEPNHDSRRKKPDDGEIDVFGAEKYFNEGIEEKNSRGANPRSRKHQHQHQHQRQRQHRHQDQHQHQLKDHTPHSRLKAQQPRTPSSHSESSWNSQTALLRSIDTEEKADPIMQSTKSAQQTDLKFAFQVSEAPLSRGLIKTVQKIQLADDGGNEDDENEGRKSLEVFGSSELDIDGIGSKSFSLERRLSMLSWDAIPRSMEEELINSPSSRGPLSESCRDDTGSDASSDLFEIKCISCTANPVVGVGPRPSSPDNCRTPTTCYAPSEASIEWSVVTASAADFSVISDSEDQRSTPIASSANPPKRPPATTKPRPRILLGCKSQKAVRVAGQVHRALPSTNRKGNKLESEKQKMQMVKYSENKGLASVSMSRFQAEAKVTGGIQNEQRQDVMRSP